MQATNAVKNLAPKVFDMVFEGFIKAHETDHVAATHVGEVIGPDGAEIFLPYMCKSTLSIQLELIMWRQCLLMLLSKR